MNSFINCDANLCIGCRTCEVSCVLAHTKDEQLSAVNASDFRSRLNVVKSAELSGAVMCRHCENAPCVRACPTAALVEDGDSIQVVQNKCIGCKSCELACPFGAISVEKTPQGKSQVLKCDLCKTRATGSGPACVAACPTNALSVFDGAQLEQIRKQRQQGTMACSV